MAPTSRPIAPSERIAVSRPEPGPLTNTSTRFMPCSIARRPAASAAICAAYGVDLREPLKPTVPADAQAITLPFGSVIEMTVLLNVLLMCAWPATTFFFSLRRTFLAAVLRPAVAISLELLLILALCKRRVALLGLLLAGDGFARALAGAGVGARALAAYGQATAVTTSLVGTDLDLAPDVGRNLATKITFNLIVRFDPVAKRHQVLVAQLVYPQVATDLGGLQGLQGAGLADAIDVGEGHLQALVAWEVNPDKACHQVSTTFRLIDGLAPYAC